jgi:hypothetical protein
MGPSVAFVPDGPLWIHEIKHYGYRFICRRDGDRVRAFTRSGLCRRVLPCANRLTALEKSINFAPESRLRLALAGRWSRR